MSARAAPGPMLRATLRGGVFLAACALFAAVLLTGTESLTRERIAAARLQAERDALAVVLPPSLHDNDPLQDLVRVVAPRWLGSPRPLRVWRARSGGAPAALALEAVAPDGYAGPIHLLIGVDADGRVTGVRVVEHRETPGLGDAIEAARSGWIDRFRGRALGAPAAAGWEVRKHGGAFDQFAGATVTPRAVVRAVHRALRYLEVHGDALYAAPADGELRHDDAPP